MIVENNEAVKIFTTHDGYDIFPGDRYYTVRIGKVKIDDCANIFVKKYLDMMRKRYVDGYLPSRIVGPTINPKAHQPSGDLKYFVEKKNAKQFLHSIMNAN